MLTGSPNRSTDQIGKNCPKNVRKLRLQSLRTIFGHFRTFFGIFRTFVDIPFFWAVQPFSRYKYRSWPDPNYIRHIIKGRQPTPKTTHPNKEVCTNSLCSLSCCLFLATKSKTLSVPLFWRVPRLHALINDFKI